MLLLLFEQKNDSHCYFRTASANTFPFPPRQVLYFPHNDSATITYECKKGDGGDIWVRRTKECSFFATRQEGEGDRKKVTM